jgi:hypothetical protein
VILDHTTHLGAGCTCVGLPSERCASAFSRSLRGKARIAIGSAGGGRIWMHSGLKSRRSGSWSGSDAPGSRSASTPQSRSPLASPLRPTPSSGASA